VEGIICGLIHAMSPLEANHKELQHTWR